MTTKTKQTSSNRSAKRSNLLLFASILIAISSLFLSLVAMQLIDWNGESDSFNTTTMQSKQARYAFCHDQQITPCTDAAIETWNLQNPDATFRP